MSHSLRVMFLVKITTRGATKTAEQLTSINCSAGNILPEVAGSVRYSLNSVPSAAVAYRPSVGFVALFALQTQPIPAPAAPAIVEELASGLLGEPIK